MIFKLTPMLILCGAAVCVGIPYGIFQFFNKQDATAGIVGVYVLVGVLVALVLLGIDRLLVRYIPLLPLSLAELVLIVTAVAWLFYTSRVFTLDLTQVPDDHYFVFFTDAQPNDKKTEFVFPFSKKLVPAQANAVFLDTRVQQQYDLKIKTPNFPEGYMSQSLPPEPGKYTGGMFCSWGKKEYTPALIDSLRKAVLAQVNQ